MSTLTGNLIANTYKQLLQVGSGNDGLTSTEQSVQDGSGENSALKLSKSAVDVNGTFKLNGEAITANASAINAITDLTGITGIVAVSGGNALGRTLTAGAGIAITNANGTEGNPTVAVSLSGTTIHVAKVSASAATITGIVSAAFFVGDGRNLTNVPSAEGGTVKQVDAGTGIKMTVGGAVSGSIPVSGVIAVSADQNFGTVSVSTAFAATGSAVFGILSATNIDSDELLMAGVSAANVTEVAAVSALTKTNLDAITSINSIIGDGGNFATSAELATVSAALATSIGNTNTALTGLSATLATSIGTANTRITSVSDFAVALSGTLATSIGTANTRITSVSDYAVALSATLATSIGTANTRITSVSDFAVALSATMATSIGNRTAAITSINSVIGDGSGFITPSQLATVSAALATSIGTANTRITSVSDYAVALSATLATSIGNRTGAITSVNTVITNLSATLATSIGTANTRITSVSDFAVALSATLATSVGTRLAIASNLSDLNNAGTARTNLGVAIGSDVEAFDADILKADTADELTAGFSAAAHSAGTKSSGTYTPDVDDGNFQFATNGGAHTLGVPAKNCTMVILYKNNASAGTLTTSGYTVTDGDDLTTTNGHEFFLYITRINDGSTTFSMLTVKALQ